MKWFKTEPKRNLFVIAVVIAFTTAFLFYTAQLSTDRASAAPSNTSEHCLLTPAATFTGANLGGIVDGTSPCWNPGAGAARDVTFSATGLPASAPSAVEVSLTMGSPNHTWMSDITAVLIAPNGASHTLFGHTGGTTATALGDSSDLGAEYIFSDNAPAPPSGGWWQAATAAGAAAVMPTGTYRTTASGGAGAVNPQPPTNLTAAFSGVSNPNGTWTLRFTDSCTGDTGAVTAASLTLTAAPSVPVDANSDFNGDGKTDFTVARGTNTPLAESSVLTPGRNYSSLEERPSKTISSDGDSAVPQAPPIYWYTSINGSATTGVGQLGDAATDFITPEDFDGDGKDDLAVWTEGAPNSANFKVLNSTTNTVQVHTFGQTGDDPAVVGDYDGDNKADPAVYRCPAVGTGDGQCFFYFRGSMNNPSGNITYIPWGFGEDGDFFPNVGDFDGDGKNDFCIQRANPSSPSNGQFVLLKSNGGGIEYVNWGLSSDFILPGDYDGDGKADFCVRRTVGGNRQHWILTRTGATSFTVWGITGDASTPGDYDGDNKTDIAIWRGSATPGESRFWVLNSSNGSITTKTWGQCASLATCDFAVAGWAVH